MKIKPESEIFSHITLMSVISGLFHCSIQYFFNAIVSIRGLVNSQGKLGCRGYLSTPPTDILAATLT